MTLASSATRRLALPVRALAALLVVALWFAGTLGLMHRSMHAHGLAMSPAAGHAVHGHDHGHAHDHDHAAHGLAKLFGEHTDADCRLYDQLAHGAGAIGVPLLALPALLPSATFAYLQGEALARWVALFDARGPPSTR